MPFPSAGNVSVNVFFNITQPVLSRGQLHWALNNVASYRTPGCTALLSDLYDERTRYLSSQEVEPGNNTVDYSLQQSASSAEKPQVQASARHRIEIPKEKVFMILLSMKFVIPEPAMGMQKQPKSMLAADICVWRECGTSG